MMAAINKVISTGCKAIRAILPECSKKAAMESVLYYVSR